MRPSTTRLIEFVFWVAFASTIVSGIAAAIGFAAGGTLLAVKYALFVVGILLFGVGSITIRPGPAAPHKSKSLSIEGDSQLRFESWLQTLPPLKNQPLRFEDRIDRSWKVFASSLVILGISLVLEFGLNVTVGQS